MKNGKTIGIIAMLMIVTLSALAQSDATATSAPFDLGTFLAGLVVKFPWITTILLVMSCLRLVFKPVMTFLHERAASTTDTADDVALEKFEAGPVYKAISFILDLFTSVKLPPK